MTKKQAEAINTAPKPAEEAVLPPALPRPKLEAAASPVELAAEAPEPDSPVTINTLMVDEQTAALGFDFGRRPPAAVFGPPDQLWMVFDTTRPIIVPELPKEVAAKIRSIETESIDKAQIVRIALADGVVGSVSSHG